MAVSRVFQVIATRGCERFLIIHITYDHHSKMFVLEISRERGPRQLYKEV